MICALGAFDNHPATYKIYTRVAATVTPTSTATHSSNFLFYLYHSIEVFTEDLKQTSKDSGSLVSWLLVT